MGTIWLMLPYGKKFLETNDQIIASLKMLGQFQCLLEMWLWNQSKSFLKYHFSLDMPWKIPVYMNLLSILL